MHFLLQNFLIINLNMEKEELETTKTRLGVNFKERGKTLA